MIVFSKENPMKHQRNVAVLVANTLAFALLSGGCGSDDKSNNNAGAGGQTSGTGGGSSVTCPAMTSVCGGDVANLVGTWTVSASCLAVSGNLDMSSAGIDCTSSTLSNESLKVTGSITFDGTSMMYTDNTTTTTTAPAQIALGATCKNLSGTNTTCQRLGDVAVPNMGYTSSPVCADDSATGGCACTGGVNQTGGIGVVSNNPGTNDTYSASGTVLALMNGHAAVNYQYCVSGSTLTLTPQTTGITTTGTITLAK